MKIRFRPFRAGPTPPTSLHGPPYRGPGHSIRPMTMFRPCRSGGRSRPREFDMDFEKYTDRARGSAQSLALREGHQQFAPEHILKVLLDDPEGLAAGLIDRSGGRSREALAAVEAALAKRPKVSGGGAGQVYLDQPWRACSTKPRRSPRRPATAT